MILKATQARVRSRHEWPASRKPQRGVLRPTTCSLSNSRTAAVDRTLSLRQLLAAPRILLGPAAYDGISAKLVEQAGFDFTFMSGFCASAARLGAPDTGLLSYAEVLDVGRGMHEATARLPIIGDADTGYGNAVNVKRTVRGFAAAGFAGILLEDQVWPKSCGHVRNKRVVPREEAVARIRAACDARDEGKDIVIIARTDARQAESLEEALWRVAAFADAGADIVFGDALTSVEEMRRLCATAPRAYKMANNLEGGGKTPLLLPQQLEDLGFKLCAFPLSLLGVSVRAMETALQGLRAGMVPQPPAMPTFQELQAVVGFPEYFAEEDRYAVSLPTAGLSSNTTGAAAAAIAGAVTAAAAAVSNSTSGVPVPASNTPPGSSPPATVEADAVVEPGEPGANGPDGSTAARTIDLISLGTGEDQYGTSDAARQPKWLRLKITDPRTGAVRLESRFPAGFLGTVTSFVPQVAGVDLEGLLKQAKGSQWDPTKPVLDFDSGEDRVEIFLEFS